MTYPLFEHLLKLRNDVMTLDAVNVKAFCPALQDALIDGILGSGIGEGETQGQLAQFLALVMVVYKLLETIGNVLPQFICIARLEFFGHSVLGLDDFKRAFFFCQVDLTHAQVGSAHIEGQEGSLFVTRGEAHDPGYIHRL